MNNNTPKHEQIAQEIIADCYETDMPFFRQLINIKLELFELYVREDERQKVQQHSLNMIDLSLKKQPNER